MTVWTRSGNIWWMIPLPCVTVEPSPYGWEAKCAGRLLHHIPRSRSSAEVRAAAHKYFDERVELYNASM